MFIILYAVVEFLDEYKDIIANDIFDGLPTVRSINHYGFDS